MKDQLIRRYIAVINESVQSIETLLNEKWDVETTVSPEERGKYKGKTKAELLRMYNELKKSGPHKRGSPEFGRMRELAFAVRAKSDWGKVGDE